MNKTRLPILIIVVSLILTSVIAVQALANSSESTSNRAGMGDLQRFEAQQALVNSSGNTGNRAGMGDLQRFEAQQALANSSGSSSNRAGMGDLQRFEAQQALANTGDYASSRVGMGDLQRFEAQQAIVNARTSSSGTSNRVCPNLSTSYGEKDAGASAPASVLRATGCGIPASK